MRQEQTLNYQAFLGTFVQWFALGAQVTQLTALLCVHKRTLARKVWSSSQHLNQDSQGWDVQSVLTQLNEGYIHIRVCGALQVGKVV